MNFFPGNTLSNSSMTSVVHMYQKSLVFQLLLLGMAQFVSTIITFSDFALSSAANV